ncbi:MAG: hypothetical protein LBR47_04735 [Spirochaetaceae bacterium]|nr:hypothetical protein [Spirochaetaceae bacterium]
MKCSICGKTESDIKKIITDIITKLQSVLESTNASINAVSMDKNISEYTENNGFTTENKNKLKSINETIKAIKLNAFIENKDSFMQMEPKLEILYKYYTDKRNGFIPQSSYHSLTQTTPVRHLQNIQINVSTYTIGELIEYFCSEPDDGKITKLQSVFNKDTSRLKSQREEIEMAIERLQATEKYMFETHISFKHYEISGTPKVLPPQPYSRYDSRHATPNPGTDIENTLSKFCPNEYKNATHLVLCPFCKAMFAISSYGALSYKYAEEAAMMDDDDD